LVQFVFFHQNLHFLMHTLFPPRVPRPARRGDPEYKTKAQAAWMRCRAALFATALGLIGAGSAQAQVSTYSFAVAAGTYTDLGTSGTAIGAAQGVTSNDDDTSNELPIGFNFTYNGTTFTRFMFNTNGFIKLGTAGMTGPSSDALFATTRTGTTTNVFSSTNAADINIISATNTDWNAGTGVEFRYALAGTAPNRTLTVQWKNVADDWGTQQYTAANFQIILTETSNTVQIRHGVWTPLTPLATTNSFISSAAGLKGASGNVRSLSKASSTSALSATAGTSTASTWSIARPLSSTTAPATPAPPHIQRQHLHLHAAGVGRSGHFGYHRLAPHDGERGERQQRQRDAAPRRGHDR
jgi:hypothetical protein